MIYNRSKHMRKTALALTGMLIIFLLSFIEPNNSSAKDKTVNMSGTIKLYEGQTCKIKNKKLVMKSHNKKIVNVTTKSRLKAGRAGTTKVTVYARKNKKLVKKSTTKVKVGKYMTGFKVNNASTIILKKGKTAQLKLKITPSKVLYNKAAFKVADSNIASVNSKGMVTGINMGTTTIKVTSKAVTKNGKKKSKKLTIVVIDSGMDHIPVNTENVYDTTKRFDKISILPGNTTDSPTSGSTAMPDNTAEPMQPTAPANPTDNPQNPTDNPQKPTDGPEQTEAPLVTAAPGSEPSVPTQAPPTPTKAPQTVDEYIKTLVPDSNNPLVAQFVVSDGASERTIYLLNKSYTGKMQLRIDDYTYEGSENVAKLLNSLENERMIVVNNAGTVRVGRRSKETLWTVEFLKTGKIYEFSGKVNDTIYGSPYGIVIGMGNTLNNIKITTK